MKDITTNNNALSYSIVTIFAVLIFMSVFWSALATTVNELSDEQDKFVEAGEISEQTQRFYNLSVNLFRSTILFGILGLALWGIRQSKITSSSDVKSMTLLIGSTTVMLVLSFVSVILLFAFGHSLDMTLLGIVEAGILDSADIYEENNFAIVDLFYIASIAPALIGIAIHLLTSVEKIGYGTTTEQTLAMDDYYIPEA